jgi:putative PIN family toxin of toxin-antitoxin system
MMKVPEIVIDTNVLVAALRSRRGASHKLLRLIDSGKFSMSISVPLILEYEDAAKRSLDSISLTIHDIGDIINYICRIAKRRNIFYLWRPFLKDPKDDMVLELAVAGQCSTIVTFNTKDFEGVEQFGVRVMTPKKFLEEIGELK